MKSWYEEKMKEKHLFLLIILMIATVNLGCIGQKNDVISNNTTSNDTVSNGTGSNNVSILEENIQHPLGIFYYPWTGGNPEKSPGAKETWLHWKDGGNNPPKTWASRYIPDYGSSSDPYNGLYSSKDTNIIRQQLTLINKSGINFVISSWWGQNHYTDQALDIIFKQVLSAKDSPYGGKFCIYYEKEGFGDIPKSEIISDINYIKAKYATSPYYYKIDGRPVVFVYNTKSGLVSETFEQEIQKWKEVRDETGIYTVLKIGAGYKNMINYADSWHEYAPASSFKQTDNYSAFVSPGFHKWSESPRLERENFTRFENDIIALKNANVQFKLIETWNEWGEGTGIEPARKINHEDVNGFTVTEPSYGTRYIDIIAKYFAN
jgi:hypothetical protein